MIPSEVWTLPRPRPDYYVGSFPLHFEKKLWRLLGEPEKVLHPFGGLAQIGDTVDLNPTVSPTWTADAHNLSFIPDETYDVVVLDPPYSDQLADELYGGMPKPRFKTYTAEAVRVCRTGGHVAMYHWVLTPRLDGTKLVHRIVVLTRTWHRPRVCQIFQKLSAEERAAFESAHE